MIPAKIAHSTAYARALEKVLTTNEDILAQSEIAIKHCRGNYTAWSRRKAFVLGKNSHKETHAEIEFVWGFLLENKKCYQAWSYLQDLVDTVGTFEKELEELLVIHETDSKNHHAWSYRRWLFQKRPSENIQREMQLSREMVEEDPWNNSAWCYRMFLVGYLCTEDVHREVSFAAKMAAQTPANRAVLRYFLGLGRKNKTPHYRHTAEALLSQVLPLEDPETIRFCAELSVLLGLELPGLERPGRRDVSLLASTRR
ncbi:MAG: farnesyltransferase/geranylgeranyltransferase type I alpha subunit [Amphiamblys sp. WSBS2006]|nr:MAG: farnesyltransferase/geranylgeranyltransferase type I alpha subunit [Amphiamblys sp. WSBS2006]